MMEKKLLEYLKMGTNYINQRKIKYLRPISVMMTKEFFTKTYILIMYQLSHINALIYSSNI